MSATPPGLVRVVGTGDSKTIRDTDRVVVSTGIQGPAGRDGTVFRWLGAWNSTTTYTADDAVYEADTGAAWICLKTNLNNKPSSDIDGSWSVLADPRQGIANHETSQTPRHDQYQNRTGWPKDEPNDLYYTGLSYDEGLRQVILNSDSNDTYTSETFDPVTDFRFYVNGVRYEKTGPVTFQHGTAEDGYFCFFDENGDPQVWRETVEGPWDLMKHAPVAFVYYSGSKGIAYEERHTIYRDPKIHEALHFSVGTFIQSGFNISNYTLDTGTPAGIRWSLASGVVRDEDLATLVDSITGVDDYTLAWRTGTAGTWDWLTGQSDPLLSGATYAQWNEYTGSTWQLTEAANGQRVNYFIFATPGLDSEKQILVVPGQQVHNFLAEAEGEVLESINMGGLVAQEIAGIWRIIFRLNNANSSAGKAEIEQVDQIFSQRSGSVTASAPTDHQTLSGRSEAQSHPASAIEVTPAGDIAAVNVQTALEELDTEKYNAGDLLLAGYGTKPAVGIGWSGDPDTGFYGGNASWKHAISGVEQYLQAAGEVRYRQDMKIGWGSSPNPSDAQADVVLRRDAAAVLAQRNGIVGQTFRLYGDYTDSSNYAYAYIEADEVLSVFKIQSHNFGTKNLMQIEVGYFGTSIWRFSSGGQFEPVTNNQRDLGATSLRWRDGYFGTDLYVGDQVLTDYGTAADPGYAFDGEAGTGMFRPGAAQIGFALNGTHKLNLNADAFYPAVDSTYDLGSSAYSWDDAWINNVYFSGGSAPAPSISFESDTDTGFMLGAADLVEYVAGGTSEGEVVAKLQPAALHIMGGNIPSPSAAATFSVRRSEIAGTVKKVYAKVTSGTSVTVNVQQDGLDLRSADLVVTAGAGWTDFGTLQNATLAGGDDITIEIVSVSGTPAEVAFQIEVEPS